MLHEMLNLPIGTSEFFLWREALFLPKWGICTLPESSGVEKNIIEVAKRMDLIREHFGRPVRVTSWYRPVNYNALIGGAIRSRHLIGQAVDFTVVGLTCDYVRGVLFHQLEDFNIRMENLPQSKWVHIDIACTENMNKEQRYFRP